MQLVPQPGQEFGRVAERVGIGPRQATRQHQPIERRFAIKDPAQPPHELDVAQAAGRPLHVWFQERDGFAKLHRFLASGIDDGPGLPRLSSLHETTQPGVEPREQVRVAR